MKVVNLGIGCVYTAAPTQFDKHLPAAERQPWRNSGAESTIEPKQQIGFPMSSSESSNRRRRSSSSSGSGTGSSKRRRRERSRDSRLRSAPLWAILLPGFAQWRQHNKATALVGICATIINWVAVVWLALFWFTDRAQFFGIITDTNVLLGSEIWLAIYLLICLALGGHLIWLVTSSGLRQKAKVFVAAAVAVITAIQVSVFGTFIGDLQAQRDLVQNVFSAPKGDAAEAAMAPRYNILLLGGDAGVGRLGLRPDSISVLSVNRNTGKTLIIGIPRNMQRVPFSKGSPMLKPFPHGFNCGPKACLLNDIYAYGMAHKNLYKGAKYKGKRAGIEATKEAVQGILGIKVSYTILTDMGGFANLVYAIGGIDVCVPQRTIAEDKVTVFKKGCQHMNGGQALLYARTRYDFDDYHRMLKQRAIQRAMIAQISPEKLVSSFQKISAGFQKYLSTDIPASNLGNLLALAYNARSLPVANLEITPPKFNMVTPNFTKIRQATRAAIASN
jgi:LCP family protein required for cell wall assembly